MDQTGHHFSGIFESSEMKMKPLDEKNLVKRAINSGLSYAPEDKTVGGVTVHLSLCCLILTTEFASLSICLSQQITIEEFG